MTVKLEEVVWSGTDYSMGKTELYKIAEKLGPEYPGVSLEVRRNEIKYHAPFSGGVLITSGLYLSPNGKYEIIHFDEKPSSLL